MNAESTVCNNPIVLTQETVCFGGLILDYRLNAYLSHAKRFRIRVTSGSETAEYAIGNDIEKALRIYHIIVGGRVTPCGLADVLYDLVDS